MKDAIGQEIKVGDSVCHCGGHYSDAKIREVTKINPKRVQCDGHSNLDPSTLIVVTDNLKVVRGESVVISNERLESLVDDSNLLTCLHGAGIDNCEAYSHGYQDFTELKNST